MSSYDDRPRRYHDPRDSRYVETAHEYYPSHGTELVPRSSRVEGDMSMEPYRERDIRRSRSSGPYYIDEEYYGSRYADPRDYDRAHDRRRHKKGSSQFVMAEERSRHRVLSKEQKIMAALAGAALFAGGKELVDRHQAEEEGTAIQRNPLASAALGAAGALAGYQGAEIYNKKASKHKSKHVIKGRNGRVEEEYWTDSSDGEDGKHSNSFLKNALAAAGVGKIMRSLTSGSDDRSVHSHRSHSRRSRRGRSASSSRSRSRSRSETGAEKIQKAAVASLLAGASEAFRIYKQPGSWKGEKTKRVLTAAATAGGIDAAHDTEHRKLGLLEAVMGGLVGTRALHGSKKDIYEDETGRSRSRSRVRSRSRSGGRSHSKAAGPAAAIAGAILGKKALDRSRSRSQSRGRRDDSVDSYGSRKSKRSFRERSRSAVRKLMGKSEDDNSRYDDKYYHDYEEDKSQYSRHHRDYDRPHSRSQSMASYRDRPRGGGGYSSESDLGNSDDEDKEYKKMRGKSIITSGLAAVATIHAAHGVYQSYEKRQKRQKAVKEGRLTEAEASHLRKKALLQDAASVGIAALGVKGAISEMKEAKELNDQCKEFKHQRDYHHQKRIERQRQFRGIEDRWASDDEYYLEDDIYYQRPVSSSHQLPAPRYD